MAILAVATLTVAALGARTAVFRACATALGVRVAFAVAAAEAAGACAALAGGVGWAKLRIVRGLAVRSANGCIGTDADAGTRRALGHIAVLGLRVALLTVWAVLFDQTRRGGTRAGIDQDRVLVGVKRPQVIGLGIRQWVGIADDRLIVTAAAHIQAGCDPQAQAADPGPRRREISPSIRVVASHLLHRVPFFALPLRRCDAAVSQHSKFRRRTH